MNSHAPLSDRFNNQIEKAKEDLVTTLQAPYWLFPVSLGLTIAGGFLAMSFELNAMQLEGWPVIVGSLMFALGFVLFFTLAHDRAVRRTHEDYLGYKLSYFDKIVASVTSDQVTQVDLDRNRSSKKWVADMTSTIIPFYRLLLRTPLVTLQLAILGGFLLYLTGEATIEDLKTPEATAWLVNLSFKVAWFGLLVFTIFRIIQVQVIQNIPRTKAILSAAGISGINPEHARLLPKMAD